MGDVPEAFWGSTKSVPATEIVTDENIRCICNRLLAELASRPWRIKCPRCHTVVHSTDYVQPKTGGRRQSRA